jgi:molybdenum cofactor guanylyltransferase
LIISSYTQFISIMIGVVLCGGQSTRMGTDKGLLKLPLPHKGGNMFAHEASTWAQTAAEKLSELQLPVIVSVNALQYNDYATIFPAQQVVTDDPSLLIKGPLCGLLSVHLQYPHEDLLILACDLPLMEIQILKELTHHYHENKNAEAFTYTSNGEPEPLCGIYKAAGLAHIFHLYQSAHLHKHSMKYMLEHLNTGFLPVTEDKKKCFRNFNAHAELNGL